MIMSGIEMSARVSVAYIVSGFFFIFLCEGQDCVATYTSDTLYCQSKTTEILCVVFNFLVRARSSLLFKYYNVR